MLLEFLLVTAGSSSVACCVMAMMLVVTLFLLISLSLISCKYINSDRDEENETFLQAKITRIKSIRGLNNTITVPFSFPLYLQCDDAWGSDIMDTKTICSVGKYITLTFLLTLTGQII